MVAGRHGLGVAAARALGALLEALEAEPDPPTTAREGIEALDTHVADSLSALELGEIGPGARIADIGAGAGFPGLALAVALPGAQVTLVEATRRKCEVIERLAQAADLQNTHVVAQRVEEWGASEGRCAHDVVTARALAALPVLVEYAAPLLDAGGVLIAYKGARDAEEEAAGAAAAGEVGMAPRRVERVTPFPRARDRNLHVYSKMTATPARFPRRPGMARRRPLG